jgi:hypothetical protein
MASSSPKLQDATLNKGSRCRPRKVHVHAGAPGNHIYPATAKTPNLEILWTAEMMSIESAEREWQGHFRFVSYTIYKQVQKGRGKMGLK